MRSILPPFRMLVRCAAVLVVIGVVGGFLTIWSGIYDVAASRGHWPGFELLLKFGMRSSVRTHAWWIDVPPLDDPDRVRRGAAHYQQGCAPCHGSPAGPSMLVVRRMLPEPSDLKTKVPTWKANELFWIVKNGLKYTGMPAWPTLQRDDEVWDMVAFLRELPDTAPERYLQLAGLRADDAPAAERPADRRHDRTALLASCARCHGVDGRGRETNAFPRLDLQTEGWLLDQLQAFAHGRRASGVMQAATAELTAEEMAWLATHYSARPKAAATTAMARSTAPDPSHREGEAVFLAGNPDQGLPPCAACHARTAAARDRLYPALLGQYASYTTTQLGMFREGKRKATEAARLMTAIAERMTDAQVRAVAVYLAAQPAGPVAE
jgi:cytochrome c553